MERRFDIHLRLHYEPSSLRPWLVCAALFACVGELASENVSLETYYPAPSGVYTQLIATSNAFMARDTGFLDVGTNVPPSATTKMAVMGGNVGIGTTAPTTMLEVNKGAVGGDGIQIDGTNDTRLRIGTGEPTVWSWSNGWITPGDLSLIQEGVSGDVIYVKPGGNVGLGTTLPAAQLDVNGSFGGPQNEGMLHVSGNVAPSTVVQGAYIGWNALTGGTGETDFINSKGGGPGGFTFMNGVGNSLVTFASPGYVYVNAANNACSSMTTNNGTCPAGMYISWVAGLYVDNQWWSSGPDVNIFAAPPGQQANIATTAPYYYCCWK